MQGGRPQNDRGGDPKNGGTNKNTNNGNNTIENFEEEESSESIPGKDGSDSSKFPLPPSTDENVEVEVTTTKERPPTPLEEQLAGMSPEVRAVVAEWQSCFEKPIALTKNTLKFAAILVERLIEPGEVKGCRDWKIENDEDGYYAKHGMSLETIEKELDRYRSRSVPVAGKSLLVEPSAEIQAVLAESEEVPGMTREQYRWLVGQLRTYEQELGCGPVFVFGRREVAPGVFHLGLATGPGPRIHLTHPNDWVGLDQAVVDHAIEYGLLEAERQQVYA